MVGYGPMEIIKAQGALISAAKAETHAASAVTVADQAIL